MAIDPLSLTLMAVNVGTSVFNNKRNNKLSRELREKQEKYARAAADRDKQRMWQLMREGQELSLELEREIHESRLKDIEQDFARTLYRLTFAQAIKTWPLKVLPIVMKNQSLGSLDSVAAENIAMHCILTPSNCMAFNKYIFPIIEGKLADFLNLHWNTLSSHPILFYSGAWKTGTEPTGVEVEHLKTNLSNLPFLLITPFFKPEGGLEFQLKAWGMGVDFDNEIECSDFSYAESYRSGIDYQMEEDIKDRTVEELVPYLQCLIGYIADQYFWMNHTTPPLLPSLLAMNMVNTDGMKYLNTASENLYSRLLENNLKNVLFVERNMLLLKSITPILNRANVKDVASMLFYQYCSAKETIDNQWTIEEIFLQENSFGIEDTSFLNDFVAVYEPIAINEKIELNKSKKQIKKLLKMNSETYMQKRDELVQIIDETIKIDELADIDKKELESIKKKCQENQFNIVLIGEFQGGKSTTFNAFCDGREISPRGFGIKTSACRISATNISDISKEEFAYISWKTNQELLKNINNLLTKHIKRECLELKEADYRELYEILDLNNEKHCALIEDAIENELEANKGGNQTEEYDLCIIAKIILKYHQSEELKKIQQENYFKIEDVSKYVAFPENLYQSANDNFEGCSVDDFMFAFIANVECYIHSKNLQRIGCTIVDCPGLFVSSWDTDVAYDALRKADAVIYLLGGDKEMSLGDEKALRTIRMFNSSSITNKMFIAMNTRKGKKATEQIVNKNRIKLAKLGFDNIEIHRFNAQLMFLSAFADLLIQKKQDVFSEKRFISIQASNDIEGGNIQSIWIKSVNRCYSGLAICKDDGDELRINQMSVDSVKDALKYSDASIFFGKIENFVIDKKAYSILVESGADNIVKSLNEVSAKLQKQEEDSLKTIGECEAEFQRSKKMYSDLQTEILGIIDEENYEESLVNPIASKGYDIVFSPQNIEQTSVNITLEICKELSWKMKGKMLAMKALELALKNGIIFDKLIREYADLNCEIRSIIERVILNNYGSVFKFAISNWANDVLKGNDETYKNYAAPIFKRIDRDVRRSWKRCNDENIQCYEIKELPQNIGSINLNVSNELSGNVTGQISYGVTEHVSTSAVNVIIASVITAVMTYIGGWIGIIIAELFTGTFWIQILSAIVGMLVAGGATGNHFMKKTKDELSKEEHKIYEIIHPVLNKSVEDRKDDLTLKLKEIPRILVVSYKDFYKSELLSIECKLKDEIEKRREAKKGSIEAHQNFVKSAKEKREKVIKPIIKRLNDFIESCCV